MIIIRKLLKTLLMSVCLIDVYKDKYYLAAIPDALIIGREKDVSIVRIILLGAKRVSEAFVFYALLNAFSDLT